MLIDLHTFTNALMNFLTLFRLGFFGVPGPGEGGGGGGGGLQFESIDVIVMKLEG